jgi:hypothetical protein
MKAVSDVQVSFLWGVGKVMVVVCEELGETGVCSEGMGEWWWFVRNWERQVFVVRGWESSGGL